MSVFRFCVSQPRTDKKGFQLLRALPEVQFGTSAILQSLRQGIPVPIVLDYQKDLHEMDLVEWSDKVRQTYRTLDNEFNVIEIQFAPALGDKWETVSPEAFENLLQSAMIYDEQQHD
ncbi:MAG: hypothetical protein GFH27_549289n132 [Chloroflexi bacterium AL-W]|nr:hypothetical protein [Chloroflexi bacterium AL-N1]NOK66864.1 hypothetical protein [Chloroflexi bacterium AL-N10]NOK74844.1 hypothetical protein [Chloroflexi bacterium AL-N5]NOK81467.1 hypothetical protein [Chloroflexi bacterium AL-W]NOK88936.1 hypothetical protein [Chloroflexi bacterium AL-N15]